jgi:hypothetical protein
MTGDLMPGCAWCGGPRDDGRADGRRHGGRGLCDPCYGAARRGGTLDQWPAERAPVAEVVEDIRLMISAGESTERVAARMGRSPGALAHVLYRGGARELAPAFAAAARRAHREKTRSTRTRSPRKRAGKCWSCHHDWGKGVAWNSVIKGSYSGCPTCGYCI